MKDKKEEKIAAMKRKWAKIALHKKMKEHSKDKNYILNQVVHDFEMVEFIDSQLLQDREFMMKVLQINGMTLQYVSKELKNDKLLVMTAVKNSSGFALKYASKKLRADREIVYEAVKHWRSPLKYASKELQDEINRIIDDYYSKHEI